MIGGHEGSGVVLEVGDGVTDFAPGDHVVMSFVAVCGQCRWCNSGMEYICDMGAAGDGARDADGRDVPPSHRRRPPLGHLSKVGAFSKHTVVSLGFDRQDRSAPAAGANGPAVVREFPPDTAPPRTGPRCEAATPSSSSASGASAPPPIQGARINGAAQIIAVDPVEFKQKSALGFGATHSVSTTDEAADLVRDLT